MLLDYSVYGYKVFCDEAEFSMIGNKKFKNKDYVFVKDDLEILKSAIIYGPNNTGKTSFIKSLTLLKDIINNEIISTETLEDESIYNFYVEQKIVKYKIKFLYEGYLFDYYLSFEHKKGIIDEKLNVDNILIFDRTKDNNKFPVDLFREYNDKLIVCFMPLEYKKYTDLFKQFFDNLIIFSEEKNTIFMDDVYDYLKNCDDKERENFNRIIKNADISLEEVKIFDIGNFDKSLRLMSHNIMRGMHHNYFTYFNDSNGTKRFMKYIVKILNAVKNGGVIIIDEIDNSLHTLITKSIINIFNDKNNQKAQLISTSHDLLLLDNKYLFRKDQIWFTYKDNDSLYFYSLDDFKCNKDDGARNDALKNYLRGMFGALPHPNIEEVIYEEDTTD